MKLIHSSGAVSCNTNYDASYWGCTYKESYGDHGLMTIITNTNKESVLPPFKELKTTRCGVSKPNFYNLNGTTHSSPELVFNALASPLSVSRNQELQIWYGQDWIDCTEDNNSGTTCVDVYAWYD